MNGYNAKEDRRHDRRTISLDELPAHRGRQAGPRFRDDRPVRALCYRLAVATGLRYSEIASIRPESFDWKCSSVTVEAAYTKNGDPATCPSRTTWRAIWPPRRNADPGAPFPAAGREGSRCSGPTWKPPASLM